MALWRFLSRLIAVLSFEFLRVMRKSFSTASTSFCCEDTMPVILKNNAFSTLATAITASDTGIVVANGSAFPALSAGEYFYITLVSQAGTTEIIKVTARVGNSMTVVRAQDGSTAATFQVGALVEMRVTSASITDLVDEHDQASEISIADAGNYYTSGTVEGALQEAMTRANLSASSGSSLVGYNQGGTSATNRTVRSRLQDYISVKDFGAVGDGVADDTAAIRAAIGAAGQLRVTPPQIIAVGGQTIFFPPGRYKVTDTLYYPSSVTFKGIGWGSSFEFAPTSAKNLFEPDPTKRGSGDTVHGASFEDFGAIAMNANATNGITVKSGTSAFAEFISIRRLVIKGFSGSGIRLGQDIAVRGATYFNIVDQCYLTQNYINLYIDYWGGPTVVTGGYMLPSPTSPYQMKVYASGVTVNGVSMDGQPTTGHIYSIFPLSITGVRRESAFDADTIPFLEQDYINTSDFAFYGETALTGNWLGQRGAVLKVNNYLSTSSDAVNTTSSSKFGIKASFGTPTSAGDLIPNGNIRRGLYGFTQFGTGSTMAYNTTEKFLGTGSISLIVNGAHTLSSIKKTILAADLVPYVGTRLWITCLVKANTTSYFLRLAGGGVANPTSQGYSDATAIFGDWRLHQASIQIEDALDIAAEIFSQAPNIGDAVYLGGMCAYFNGFSAMPEVQPDVRFKDTAAPTTGTWLQGDVVMNSAPAAGGTPGWVCVVAGTPGTWKAMANVAA
jgi:hypothetical protein